MLQIASICPYAAATSFIKERQVLGSSELMRHFVQVGEPGGALPFYGHQIIL